MHVSLLLLTSCVAYLFSTSATCMFLSIQAALVYREHRYDLSGSLGGKTVEEKAIVDQWLCLQLSGLGPVQVRSSFFLTELALILM